MLSTTPAPRFGAIDGPGHVSNNISPMWFEPLRYPFFRYFNPEPDLKKWELVPARFEVDFLNIKVAGC